MVKQVSKAQARRMMDRAEQMKAARAAKRKARKEGALPAQPGHLHYSRIHGRFV